MFYKGYRKIYDFKNDKIILAFVDDIKNGVITMYKANHEQNRLSQNIKKFKCKKTKKP